MSEVERNVIEFKSEFQFLEKRITDQPGATGFTESMRSRTYEPFENRMFDLEKELNRQKELIRSMEMELPRIQTSSINSEKTCNRVAEDSIKLTQKIKSDISKIEKLCVATAEEMRDKNKENKRPKQDFGAFEKKIDTKVTKAINGMHDILKKYLGIRQQDYKTKNLNGQKTKKRMNHHKSPISASGTTLNFQSSQDEPLRDVNEDSISKITPTVMLGTDQTLNDLQTIFEPTNAKKKAKRNKSASNKNSRSITPRPKSKGMKHSRSENVSLRLSPAPSSRVMEASTKKSVKKKNKQEVKQNKIYETESTKDIQGTEQRITDRRNRLEKIYQEITEKRNK